jgi:6-phosphogluconolactonase
MTLSFEIVEDPERACAALMVGAAIGGGQGRTTMWMGDERAVDPDDDRANYRMIREALLDPLGDNQPVMNRIKGELGYADGADDYERVLRDAGPPNFDLLLLGIGPDGHCASLFPNQPALSERSRLVVGVPEAGLEPFVPRISLTLPALAGARHIVFLVTGASKADAIAEAFGPGANPDPAVPASLLVPEAKRITVLMDQAAAAHLPQVQPR